MNLNLAALSATLEGIEAQLESLGAAIEAALAMLGEDDADDAAPTPPPAPVAAGAACPHPRVEPGGGFGGSGGLWFCSVCGGPAPAPKGRQG